MAVGIRCQATAGRRQKRCAVTWRTGEGPPHKGCPWNLSCHRRHFENSPFGFSCFRLLTPMSHTWYMVHRGKDMSLLEWKSSLLGLKDCFWLSSEPPHKRYMVTLHPGFSGFWWKFSPKSMIGSIRVTESTSALKLTESKVPQCGLNLGFLRGLRHHTQVIRWAVRVGLTGIQDGGP